MLITALRLELLSWLITAIQTALPAQITELNGLLIFRTNWNSTFDGLNSTQYGAALIISSTDINPAAATASGWALLYGGSGFREFRLVKFSNGFTSNANLTQVLSYGANKFNATNFVSVRLSFLYGSKTWQIFTRDDGGSAWSNPTTASDASSSIIDSTGVSGLFFGLLYKSGGSATSNNVWWDNFTITRSFQ